MKKILLIAVSAATGLPAFSDPGPANGPGYHITGTLKGIPSGKIYLKKQNLFARTSTAVDSATIANGRFELKGRVDAPAMMDIQVMPGNWKFNVFVENAPITVAADTSGAAYYDNTAHGLDAGAVIRNFTQHGSKTYDDILAMQQRNKNLDPAGSKDAIAAYAGENPSSVAGIYLYYHLYSISGRVPYEELDAMLNKFTGDAKASIYYQELNKIRANTNATRPGEIAPDFTLLKRDSTRLTLSSLRGRYVLIDFWASWCVPCRKAIPHWKSVYAKYHSKGFEILGVSNDSDWKKWKAAMDQEQMPWPQVCDEFASRLSRARVISTYMNRSIPFYVLLDKEGRIILTANDHAAIDEKLAELLDKT